MEEKTNDSILMVGGSLQRIKGSYFLQKEEEVEIRTFFTEGLMFEHVDPNLFELFPERITDSPEIFVYGYSPIKKITEEELVDDAIYAKIYNHLTMVHIRQICLRNRLGLNTLSEKGSTLFFIKDKYDHLCVIKIFINKGFNLRVYKYSPKSIWGPKDIVYF